jgi:uncharacterized FlaG/YvyC family protein
MAIPPLRGPMGTVPSPASSEAVTGASLDPSVRSSTQKPAGKAAPAQTEDVRPARAESDLDELKWLVSQGQLELRLHSLPDTNVTLIRLVEPQSGRVVREFPPERLAKVLAELRAHAAARLDRQA